jgi:Tol biopolymer transport system component
MAIAPGTRVGAYEIVALIGQGGMGEVYRARDERLGRDVAIKVLADTSATDPDRLARFRREAKILASFSHPHIAPVYGLEDIGGHPALVMELVEGETLRDRLQRGSLPISAALDVARQIALAIEAAADRAIVHRDLKPGNIVIASNGTVKVLDFGLAKEARRPVADRHDAAVTGTDATEIGIVKGTPAYMAPEQARGAAVDHRTDIWAFGCVCFEMLAGRRAFAGNDTSEVLARIQEAQPDWGALPTVVPPSVRRMLRRCLEKDPARRLRHIADARVELDEIDPPPPAAPPASWRLPALVATAAALALLVGWSAGRRTTPLPSSIGTGGATHLHLQGPPGVEALPALANGFAISPDGRTLVQIGVREGIRAVFAFDTAHAAFTEISAANPATAVAFSPDGSSLAFLSASNRLGTYSLRDGERRFLVTGVDLTSGLAWCEGGIVFARNDTLWIVEPGSSEPRQLTALDTGRGEISHGAPVCLPGQPAILYSSLTAERGAERIELIAIGGGHATTVLEQATAAAWSPTGHLLFQRAGAVSAVPFDLGARRATGSPVEVLKAGEIASNVFGSAGLTMSASGTLVYVPGDFSFRRLVAVDSTGSAKVLDAPAGRYFNPRVSPDGRLVAFDDDQSTIGLLDLARGAKTPFGPPFPGTNYSTWNRDGTRLVFRRFNRPYWATTNGRTEGSPVPDTSTGDFPISAGPDEDSVFVVRIAGETSGDIYLVSMTGGFTPRAVVSTRGFDGSPHLSRDGRWLLYQSDQTGRPEVYVAPYPSMDRRWQVSVDGGLQALWDSSGRQVYFRQGSRMLSVSMTVQGSEPIFGKPSVMFDQAYDYGQGVSAPDYSALADGRLVMIRPELGANRLHVVLNWAEELKRVLAGAPLR